MDLISTTIGLLSIILLILPFAYARRKHRINNNKLLQNFKAVAEQQQLTLSQYDFWDPFYAIGIDEQKKQLLYTQNQNGKEQQTLIDLADVGRCRVNKQTRETNGNTIIERIDLAFLMQNQKPQETSLELYSKEVNLNHTTELQLAEKWQGIVSGCLPVNPAHPSGAGPVAR